VVARPDYTNTVQGTIEQVENPLAMAIAGQGFFSVAQARGGQGGGMGDEGHVPVELIALDAPEPPVAVARLGPGHPDVFVAPVHARHTFIPGSISVVMISRGK
jgi:hypothetical protein